MDKRPDNSPAHAFVLGSNHLTASVSLRDRLLFSHTELPEFCRALLQVPGMREVVVLSTCNRSEIYGIFLAAGPESRPLIRKAMGRGQRRERGRDTQPRVFLHPRRGGTASFPRDRIAR